MDVKRFFISIILVFSVLSMSAACDHTDEAIYKLKVGETIDIDVSEDDFVISIQLTKHSEESIEVERTLTYTGDETIILNHSIPLISIQKLPIEGDFSVINSVGVSKELSPNETYTFDENKRIELSDADNTISGSAWFSVNDERYDISYDIRIE